MLRPVEREIVQLLADGLTTTEIATKLKYTPHTLERMRCDIISIMSAKNTAHLISKCYKEKILSI